MVKNTRATTKPRSVGSEKEIAEAMKARSAPVNDNVYALIFTASTQGSDVGRNDG